jgi:translation initiation factor eIF-2B subunit epsilon
MPLFGQILAALYQDDIVEEEDIRRWHVLPISKGEGTENLENVKRCWAIGGHMIQQFDEQGSDDDSSEEAGVLEAKEDNTDGDDEDEDEDDEDEDEA